MTLGEKIKQARKGKGMTQSMLAGDFMTRSMLSCIESGSSSPSLPSLTYIAKKLDLPIAYFLSDEDNVTSFVKNHKMPMIKICYKNKEFEKCITELEGIGAADDEVAMLLTECYMRHGRRLLLNGHLASATAAFEKSIENSRKTVYNTTAYENKIALYLSICKNIQAPLLEFDQKHYEELLDQEMDYEFYKYVTLDYEYSYKNETYALHLKAKKLLKENKYSSALEILSSIIKSRKYKEYNTYVMFWIYLDMENAYRQLLDFENAYKYAKKRMALIE